MSARVVHRGRWLRHVGDGESDAHLPIQRGEMKRDLALARARDRLRLAQCSPHGAPWGIPYVLTDILVEDTIA